MLKKSLRLVSEREIARVAKVGWRKTLGSVKVFFLSEKVLKMTVVVPSQVSKKATRRNRIKRLARETFRLSLTKLPVGYWLIKPQSGSFDLTYENWQSFWQEIIKLVPKNNFDTRPPAHKGLAKNSFTRP